MARWSVQGWGATPECPEYYGEVHVGFRFESEVPVIFEVVRAPWGTEVLYRRAVGREKPDFVMRGDVKNRKRFEKNWNRIKNKTLESKHPIDFEPLYDGYRMNAETMSSYLQMIAQAEAEHAEHVATRCVNLILC